MNELIEELNKTKVGCHVDGICVNNISYADDMVLLNPSIGALKRLLQICERYAVVHGLKYNVSKSELMVFKAGTKTYNVPPLTLSGAPLKTVTKFKYLGHWVTENLCDNEDIEQERRSLAVRCNVLARRFARCTRDVKITLFKAFCVSFYSCAVWVNYKQKAYDVLRVQYNNAFRVLLGLPRRCSASGMFAEARTDGFAAVMRKRCASLEARIRASPNTILSAFADHWDGPMVARWSSLHV
ncbi:uncharacterized protein LOC113232274 [Hyposmocoma kahamanoa]|uniref:uncharacterized protein LOC113232274 n=1 Tax=Hyposmocoma kahamanoa TaxID=1477025 RepID=UPI000E6D7596|nr:uncharacterized protein LOC113232274 [Hyposmocoma kahamanoa]